MRLYNLRQQQRQQRDDEHNQPHGDGQTLKGKIHNNTSGLMRKTRSDNNSFWAFRNTILSRFFPKSVKIQATSTIPL